MHRLFFILCRFVVTYLEVDNYQNNHECSEEIRQVWGILAQHRLIEGLPFILLGQHEVEKSDNSTFKFSSLLSSDCDW